MHMFRGSFKVLLLGLVIIGGIAWYLVSPLYSMSQLRDAAIAGDEAALAERVDFPSLRESFKSQLRAQLEAEMGKKEVSDNPFAVMGSTLVMGMVEPMVDSLVSPKGIKTLVAYGQFDGRGGSRPGGGKDKLKWSLERRGFNRVLAKPSAGRKDEEVALVFDRDGLGWRLVGVELGAGEPALD